MTKYDPGSGLPASCCDHFVRGAEPLQKGRINMAEFGENIRKAREEMGITHCDKFFSDSYSDQPLADIADEAFLILKDGTIAPWGK